MTPFILRDGRPYLLLSRVAARVGISAYVWLNIAEVIFTLAIAGLLPCADLRWLRQAGFNPDTWATYLSCTSSKPHSPPGPSALSNFGVPSPRRSRKRIIVDI